MMTTLNWQGGDNCLRADAGPHGVYTIEPWHDRYHLKHNGRDGCIHETVTAAQEWAQNIVNDAENPTPRRKGGFTLEDFDPIVNGEVRLPNSEEGFTLAEGVNNIASLGHMLTPKWGHGLSPEGHKAWTQYFLNVYDGSGYALIYGHKGGRVVCFAICKHQKKTGAGANPSRGWHPGHCIKCGLDLSVDSGD